jgi:hypothetical protein
MQALDDFFLPRPSMNSAPVVTSQCAVTKKAPVWGMTPPHGHHGHATMAGEHGRTGSAPSSMNHSTYVPKLMQSTASVGDGGEDTSRHATAVVGRRMSKEAVQALVCGAQCLREGLMSYFIDHDGGELHFWVAIWVLQWGGVSKCTVPPKSYFGYLCDPMEIVFIMRHYLVFGLCICLCCLFPLAITRLRRLRESPGARRSGL